MESNEIYLLHEKRLDRFRAINVSRELAGSLLLQNADFAG